jgi:hypothetical protein
VKARCFVFEIFNRQVRWGCQHCAFPYQAPFNFSACLKSGPLVAFPSHTLWSRDALSCDCSLFSRLPRFLDLDQKALSWDGTLSQLFEVWGMKVCLVWCWPDEVTFSSNSHIGIKVFGRYSFCPSARSASLLKRLPNLFWGGGFGSPNPTMRELGLELKTVS